MLAPTLCSSVILKHGHKIVQLVSLDHFIHKCCISDLNSSWMLNRTANLLFRSNSMLTQMFLVHFDI